MRVSRRGLLLGIAGGAVLAGCSSDSEGSGVDGPRGDIDARPPTTIAPAVPLAAEFGPDGHVAAIRLDGATMNWVGEHGRWGVPVVIGPDAVTEAIPHDQVVGAERATVTYTTDVPGLTVRATRSATRDGLVEEYELSLAPEYAGLGDARLGLRVPLPDDVTGGATVSLTDRSVSHLWPHGHGAWVCALRLGATPPHLGVVVDRGALDGYSVIEREVTPEGILGGTLSNDRGCLVVHPDLSQLEAAGTTTLRWHVLGHQGWADFMARRDAIASDTVRVEADRYVVTAGETIEVSAIGSASPIDGEFRVDGRLLESDGAQASIPLGEPGEVEVGFTTHDNRTARVVVVAVPPVEDLLAGRLRFLTDNKQIRDPSSPYDGAFRDLRQRDRRHRHRGGLARPQRSP